MDAVYGGPSTSPSDRVTLRTLRGKYARGEKITMVTAYDYPSATHVSWRRGSVLCRSVAQFDTKRKA